MLRQNSKVKPRIGITYSSEISVEPYAAAVRASGGDPVLLSAGSNTGDADFAGLLLGGGVDVNPVLYGEVAAPETEPPNKSRDRMEQILLAHALKTNVPVLAICRGMQLLNVSHGGSLTQHMTGHEHRPADKSLPAHTVELDPESHLARIIQVEQLPVNSRHHQAVARVGAGLRVTARSQDGTIEALEISSHRFALGVQWHPEDMAPVNAHQKLLFDAFVTCAARAK